MYEKSAIKAGEVELEVYQCGKGRPLLLLHDELGFQPDRPIFARLAEHFRVIAPSHPGFGKSSLPTWMDRAEDFSYVYLDLIEQLKLDDLILVGISLGAWIAAEIAAKSTDRIQSIILIGPVGMKLGKRDELDFPDLFALSPERLSELYYSDPLHRTRDYSAAGDDELEVIARNRETFALIAWEPYLHNPKLSRWAQRITRPALVIRGENDAVSSADYARAFVSRLPDGRLISIPQAGHLAHIDNPGAVAGAVEKFIAG